MTRNNAKIKIIPSTWLLIIANNGNLNVIYLLYAYNFMLPQFYSCILYNRINQRAVAGAQTVRTDSTHRQYAQTVRTECTHRQYAQTVRTILRHLMLISSHSFFHLLYKN